MIASFSQSLYKYFLLPSNKVSTWSYFYLNFPSLCLS